MDTEGRLRAVVPLGPDAVDDLLERADALPTPGTDRSDGRGA
jgi:hypothetical protein